jgi:hypothetical protein
VLVTGSFDAGYRIEGWAWGRDVAEKGAAFAAGDRQQCWQAGEGMLRPLPTH